ncbi:MAG: sigma-70 family RNA polymerase sigma factor [Bacteroidota bacterium]|nr:sigma-70 family RNA polymerase sigma factor [Bacteroidota bacterium]
MLLYKPVQRQLSAYCRALTADEDAAFDLLQDTLLTAFEKFDELRKTESFIYYLCSIARNRHLKQKRRWKFWSSQSETEKQSVAITPDAIEIQPDIALLHNAIAKLNTDQREVLTMFHILGFSLLEIQQQLNLSEAAVKNRLQRARYRLRQLLSDSESNALQNQSSNLSKTELI